jgi:hypothetical protein
MERLLEGFPPDGPPPILDLTGDRPVRRKARGFAEVVLITSDQLKAALTGVTYVDEIPRPGGRPFMHFVPYGPGFLGVPLCASRGGELKCWPLKGGPDDNPLAFVCVCHVDPPRRPPPPSCYLDISSSPFRMRCIRGTCTRRCGLAATRVGKGRLQAIQVGCACS